MSASTGPNTLLATKECKKTVTIREIRINTNVTDRFFVSSRPRSAAAAAVAVAAAAAAAAGPRLQSVAGVLAY